MTVTSLEIELASIDARWVVVGFGLDRMMDRLPALLRRLGPHSIWFPETTAMSLGVPRLSSMATSAYILVVNHDDGEAVSDAHQLAWSLAGSERLEMLIGVGQPAGPLSLPDGTLHLSLTEPACAEWVVSSLLLAVTSNGLIGIDFSDIRNCLHGAGPVRAWLWQGRSGQAVADAAGDFARAATTARIPPAGVKGAMVITIVPPVWTLHDMVELSACVALPESADQTLAAFTDDGPAPVPAAVVFTYSHLQAG